MHSQRIQISNFLRIRSLDLATPGVVQLICGPNEAGKSSLGEAIRYLVRGDTPRLKYKKDYRDLVSHGAKKGAVTITTDGGELSRTLPDGAFAGDAAQLPAADDLAWQIALGVTRFAALAEKDRRAFLFHLVDVDVSRDAVIERMKRRGIDGAAIEEVLPLLRGGFETAHAQAKEKVTEARADWRATTGEAYGVQKAEGWQAPRPAGEAPALEALMAARETLDAARNTLADYHRQLGAAQALQQERRALQKERGQLNDADPAPLRARAADIEASIARHTAALDAMPAPGAPVETLACPACDCALVLVEGALVHADEAAPADAEAQRQKRAGLQKTLDAERRVLDEVRRDLARIERDAARRAQIDKKLAEALPDVGYLQEQIEGAQQQAAVKEGKLKELEAAHQQWMDADAKTDMAAEHHTRAQQWGLLAEALAPDGIPGELLAEALGPVNDRIAATATAAGWLPVRIEADMGIVRADSVHYALLSESAQWRADTLLHEAIAHLAGVDMLILDRMDVLQPSDRGNALKLLSGLDSYSTILIMATLKAPPAQVPSGVTAHWLQAGEASKAAAAAA